MPNGSGLGPRIMLILVSLISDTHGFFFSLKGLFFYADKSNMGSVSSGITTGKFIYPDITQMVVYDPRQNPGEQSSRSPPKPHLPVFTVAAWALQNYELGYFDTIMCYPTLYTFVFHILKQNLPSN